MTADGPTTANTAAANTRAAANAPAAANSPAAANAAATAGAPRIYPTVHYPDVADGVAFLVEAFGFCEHVIYRDDDGDPVHTELRYGPSIVFIGSDPDSIGRCSLYVAVDDADAHCARARQAGARIERELHDTDYGSRDYTAIDPAGNRWHFGTYRPAVDPA
jgi:uncharacterized glyoxalase superfamily protein PhnB